MKGTISACLVVYNEGKLLKRCLESIKDLVDEIIVIHDGTCCDDSLEVAASYHAKIFVREHGGRCEKHRVFSFEQATCEWILMIDADEFFLPEDVEKIKLLVKSTTSDLFAFRWPIYTGKEYITGVYAQKTKPILSRKENMFYISVTHEYLATYGIQEERKDITLQHMPASYSFTFQALRKKLFPWARIEASDMVHLDDMEMFNVRNKEQNPHYIYYAQMKRFPIFMTGKLIAYDILHTGIKEGLWHASIENWKIFFLKLFTYMYLGKSLIYIKKHPEIRL